jgi:hypothetical protein
MRLASQIVHAIIPHQPSKRTMPAINVSYSRIPMPPKIVFGELRVVHGHQRQLHCTSIGHIGRGVDQVLEEKEEAEHESSQLAFVEKIAGKKKGHEPLQDGSSPKPQARAKPAEQRVPAFMHHHVRGIDEENPPCWLNAYARNQT